MGYENLALVELLRRRATEIFCIDASGDTPPLAVALGEAMALVYEEMKARWRHPVRSMGWYRATKKAFADLSQA